MKKVKLLFLSALALVGMAGCNEETYYEITFKDWNDSVIEVVKVKEGEVAQLTVDDPARAEEEWAVFTFAGWDREVAPAKFDTNYKAVYDVTRKYSIKFLDWDGSLLEEQRVLEGQMPVAPTGLVHEDRGETHYDFVGWNKEIVPAHENTWYSAQFQGTHTWLISFVSEDGSEVYQSSRVPNGVLPEYKGAAPTKANSDGYEYSFAGWDVEVSTASADTVYTAKFDKTKVDWSDAEKALMLDWMDEVAPFFQPKEDFDWYYDGTYDCISVESYEDAGDVATVFEEAGYVWDENEECYLKAIPEYENWYIIVSIYDNSEYVEEGEEITTYVDIYVEKIVPEPATLEEIIVDLCKAVGIKNPVKGTHYMEDGEGGFWCAYSFGEGTEDDLIAILEEFGEYVVPEYAKVLMEPQLDSLTSGEVCAFSAYYTKSFNIIQLLSFIDEGEIIVQFSVYAY